ncbi:hypothetical protein AOLI_G00208150 [Acnodon oligacanthus]
MIWHQIQAAKKDKRDIHVIFLDLANAFGSVPYSLLWESFSFFHIPTSITKLIQAYFEDLQLCFITANFTTSWQCVEVGFMAGCTISPLAFIMAMEVIIRASGGGGWHNASLRDKDQVQQVRQDIIKCLENINKTLLPGKLKLWCLQFRLLPHAMWPLTIYELPITTVEKMEQTMTSYVKKWLGVLFD